MIIDTSKERTRQLPFWNVERGVQGVIKSCIKDAQIGCQKCIFRRSCLCRDWSIL